MEEMRKCPFRRTAGGEFLPCYGATCAAYKEYEQMDFVPCGGSSVKSSVEHRLVPICRMLQEGGGALSV